MSGISAATVLARLQAQPALESISWPQLTRFLRLAHKVRPYIDQGGPNDEPDSLLPAEVRTFLGSVLSQTDEIVDLCWRTFGDLVGELNPKELGDDDMFRLHGTSNQIGAEPMFPPTDKCIRQECPDRKTLVEKVTVSSRLYTLRRGVLPVFTVSLYCRGCHTRYYPNYFVTNASSRHSVREYYNNFPNILHAQEHSYVEQELCIYFETQMFVSHSSAENISRVYNLALQPFTSEVSNSSLMSHELHAELVWDAFFLHALLRDRQAHGWAFVVPHQVLQKDRFNTIIDKRNYRMAGNGQEMWAHACNLCMKKWTGAEDGQSCVCDGTDVVRARCWYSDCREDLDSVKDHYCPKHVQMRHQCSILSCQALAEPSHVTCSNINHRRWEEAQMKLHSGMDNLRFRLRRTGTDRIPKAGSQSSTMVESTNLAAESVPQTADESRRRLKGRSCRRWTHNEQLFTLCCGIIVSRATFFGSEGVSGVKDFIKITFPAQHPTIKPTYIYFDNACNLLKHIRAVKDPYFDDVGIVVDVFHAQDHKEDIFCQTNCNPAKFMDLTDENGRSLFNSSAGEQSNVWFTGFSPIVREMPARRYDFFLDEMISLHNKFVADQLYRKGRMPHFKPLVT